VSSTFTCQLSIALSQGCDSLIDKDFSAERNKIKVKNLTGC
jgi:hypothetical protein